MRISTLTQYTLLLMGVAVAIAVGLTALTLPFLADRISDVARDPLLLEARLAEIRRAQWLAAFAGVLLFSVATLPLVRWASVQSRRQRMENERLLGELQASHADLGRVLEEVSNARERLELLARAVDGTAEGIVLTDVYGRIVYANPAAHHIHGFEPGELIGQDVAVFEPPGRKPLSAEIVRSSSTVGLWRGEVNARRKDGGVLPVQITATVVHDHAGVQAGMVAIVHDLSEERRQQEQLIEARSQVQAFQQSEAIKSELISIVSHELRTPLTALQGFSELLLTRGPSEAERLLWIKTINEEAQRLADILDDLLHVSRIETGTIHLQPHPVRLEEVVHQTISRFSGQTHAHQFVVSSDDPDLTVLADRGRLVQILDNLISNAVKYSPAGGKVRVHLNQTRAQASVSVTDHGLGIPAEHLPKLFTRFHRVDTPDRSAIRGTGLGLYITKELVALHGGAISVESKEGRGSTFTFTMPLVASAISPAGKVKIEEDTSC